MLFNWLFCSWRFVSLFTEPPLLQWLLNNFGHFGWWQRIFCGEKRLSGVRGNKPSLRCWYWYLEKKRNKIIASCWNGPSPEMVNDGLWEIFTLLEVYFMDFERKKRMFYNKSVKSGTRKKLDKKNNDKFTKKCFLLFSTTNEQKTRVRKGIQEQNKICFLFANQQNSPVFFIATSTHETKLLIFQQWIFSNFYRITRKKLLMSLRGRKDKL